MSTSLLLKAEYLTKRFGDKTALADVSLQIPSGRIVGLLGRNGAGKSTLLNLASGLLLPSSGSCRTLGTASSELDTPQLTRLGVVSQEARFVEWMKVEEQLAFVASFHPKWDRSLETRLMGELELDPSRRIAQLSTGDRQKLAILLGVCHRPSLLLLDEPMSSLDPIVRERTLNLLLELLRDVDCSVVISSHILHDVEKIVDWVVCLDKGRLTENAAFDTLQESYAECSLSSAAGTLPLSFNEPFVLRSESNGRLARLTVRTKSTEELQRFATNHRAELKARPLNLGEMFPYLTKAERN
jgi:ABC-2 type transport system ATP-binding protein